MSNNFYGELRQRLKSFLMTLFIKESLMTKFLGMRDIRLFFFQAWGIYTLQCIGKKTQTFLSQIEHKSWKGKVFET